MYKKYFLGEPVRLSRPFGRPNLRGEVGIVTSRPRPAVNRVGVLYEEYAVELHDTVIWINESALDKMQEVKKCEAIS